MICGIQMWCSVSNSFIHSSTHPTNVCWVPGLPLEQHARNQMVGSLSTVLKHHSLLDWRYIFWKQTPVLPAVFTQYYDSPSTSYLLSFEPKCFQLENWAFPIRHCCLLRAYQTWGHNPGSWRGSTSTVLPHSPPLMTALCVYIQHTECSHCVTDTLASMEPLAPTRNSQPANAAGTRR